MARLKDVSVDGETFKIASLNMEQVEELYPPDDTTAAVEKDPKEHTYKIVMYGLNNALEALRPLNPGDIRLWNIPRIRRELDLISFPALHRAVLAWSGLLPDLKPGEVPAAQELTKQ